MAIFIRIENDALEAGFKALAARQTPRAAITALGEAILAAAVRACERDPEAWKKISQLGPAAHPTNGTRAEVRQNAVNPGDPTSPGPSGPVGHDSEHGAASSPSQAGSPAAAAPGESRANAIQAPGSDAPAA